MPRFRRAWHGGKSWINWSATIVQRAREAQPAWAALTFKQRAKLMKAAGRRMLERYEEILAIMAREAGKLTVEGLMTEALGPLDFTNGWIAVAKPVLTRRRKLGIPLPFWLFMGKRARMDRPPRGVVGIITPWNYPLGVFFKPVIPALLAGNAVVLKPSEQTPRCGQWFVEQMQAVLPKDVIQVVHGGGDAGSAVLQQVDAAVFTGSVATGKKVAVQCAERLIPVSLELGGKDPAIVCADAPLERTAAGVTNWALHNTGQNCGAIERVYVVDAIADRFVAKLTSAFKRLRVGTGAADENPDTLDISPMNNAMQLRIVEEHVADAIAKGATLLAGGTRNGMTGLGYPPTLLDNCTHDMKIVADETFGPVLPIIRVRDEAEAVRMSNDTRYGLNASVWTRDLAKGKRLALQLQAGTVFVNNHAVSGAMPACPWTGVKDSGYGVANSEFALEIFTRPRTLFYDTSKQCDPFWFPLDGDLHRMGRDIATAQLSPLKLIFNPVRLTKFLLANLRRPGTIKKFFSQD